MMLKCHVIFFFFCSYRKQGLGLGLFNIQHRAKVPSVKNFCFPLCPILKLPKLSKPIRKSLIICPLNVYVCLCYHTHVNDFLGSLAGEIWDGPEGGQDPLYALTIALHVVF